MPNVIASQSVRFWDVHCFVQPWLDAAGEWPMAGTQAWFDLGATHPRKWAALLDAARHHALRCETAQAALAEASRDISAAADWGAVANEIRRRREAYIPRRAS
jgi:hypothetical protein